MKYAAILLTILAFSGVLPAQDSEPDPWPPTHDAVAEEKLPEALPDPPEPDCDHTSNSAERFEAVRLLPPLKIRNFDLRNIEYTFEDKAGLHVGTVTANKDTVLPANIWKEYKSKHWWVLYCSKDGHAYTIVEVTSEQMQEYKAPKRVPKKL
jgi:hypothetical protein